MKKTDRLPKSFTRRLTSSLSYHDLNRNLDVFCHDHDLVCNQVIISAEYEHSYYDSVETHVLLTGFRQENDQEYFLRMEQEDAKKKRDVENAKKSKAKDREAQALKDKQEYARLKKQFEGVEIDPNSI